MTLPRGLDEGTVLKATEYLEAHINCRCTLVPRTKSYAEITGDPSIPDKRPPIKTGAQEFAKLSPDLQRQILGPGKYDLYSQGVPLEAFVNRAVSPEWGAALVAKPLFQIQSELETMGWQPYQSFEGSDLLAGRSAHAAPVQIAQKAPGEFTTLDEAKAWFAKTYPGMQLDNLAGADIDVVNGLFAGFDRVTAQFPGSLDRFRIVSFDRLAPNIYAHVSGAIEKGGKWEHTAAHIGWQYKDLSIVFNTDYTHNVVRDASIKLENLNNKIARLVQYRDEYQSELDRELQRLKDGGTLTPWTDPKRYADLVKTYNADIAKATLERDFLADPSHWVSSPYGDSLLSGIHAIGNGGASFHPDILKDVPGVWQYADGSLTRDGELRLVESVAVHELGHVWDLGYMSQDIEYAVKAMTNTGWGSRRDIYQEFKDAAQGAKSVSDYAKTNHNEKMAEAFTSFLMGARTQQVGYTKRLGKMITWLAKIGRYSKAELEFPAIGTDAARIARARMAVMVGQIREFIPGYYKWIDDAEIAAAKETLLEMGVPLP